jgi:O-antigen ligase
MPEHLRALVVILSLAAIVFAFSRKLLIPAIDASSFKTWRNLWVGLTLAAFLSHSFWLYVLIALCLLLATQARTKSPIALFFVGLFAVPTASVVMPGFGLVNYLISFNHVRVLSLAILLPACLMLRGQGDTLRFGKTSADRFLLGYLVLITLLQFRGTTVTDTFRQGFYAFTDVFLPYYVISRSLTTLAAHRQAIVGFVLAGLLLAAFAIFESLRHWNLYSAVVSALDPSLGFGAYLDRAGSLRASASTGHSIPLGYIFAVAIGLYLFLVPSIPSKLFQRIGLLSLCGGLYAALARGPWVGAAIIIGTFLATGRSAVKRILTLIAAGLISIPLLMTFPAGQRIVDLLPVVGNVDKFNVEYRERLIDTALIVIQRSPWFGSIDYLNTPEMEAMRQGQGIIDIVNTYIGVTLEHGLVGLALFIGFFLSVLWDIRKAMRMIEDKDSEEYLLGRALVATLAGILVIIFTVSSITIIPIVYWSVAGLGVAYAQMVRLRVTTEKTSSHQR